MRGAACATIHYSFIPTSLKAFRVPVPPGGWMQANAAKLYEDSQELQHTLERQRRDALDEKQKLEAREVKAKELESQLAVQREELDVKVAAHAKLEAAVAERHQQAEAALASAS